MDRARIKNGRMEQGSVSISELDDPDLTLERMLERWPVTAGVFVERGFLCVGCPVSPFHTVSDTCREYDLDEESFRAELRRAVSQRSGPDPSR